MSDSGVKIEVHLIQNFAPSNLNRDDTGQPKSATFGGFRRARISSQCSKRSTRREGSMAELLEQRGAVRTRQLIVEIAKTIDEKNDPVQKTIDTVAAVFEAGGLERPAKKGKKNKKTQDQESAISAEQTESEDENATEAKNITKILLFFDKDAFPKLVEVFKDNWADLTKGKEGTKQAARDKVGKILFEAVKAPDIALFGRMLEVKSSTPFGKYNMRVEAACQVAHPISTHKVDMEMDFYTAVDDLNPAEETGAGMMGVVGFNSACYYRYALVDRDQLARNLARKTERKNGKWAADLTAEDYAEADKVIEAFLEALVYAIPTGKQNSFAARNLPSFGMFVARRKGVPLSLANAFAKPVRPTKDNDDLVGLSVAALTNHWETLRKVYGHQGLLGLSFFHVDQDAGLNGLRPFPAVLEDETRKEADNRPDVVKAIDAVMKSIKSTEKENHA